MSYVYGYVGGSGVISGGCTDLVGTKMTEKLKDGVMGVRPLPCVRDEHGEIREQTVKRLFAKVDEELNELKEEIYSHLGHYGYSGDNSAKELAEEAEIPSMPPMVEEEAADTITAITTMLEALGIDAEMRDEAQRIVNNKNRSCGRL